MRPARWQAEPQLTSRASRRLGHMSPPAQGRMVIGEHFWEAAMKYLTISLLGVLAVAGAAQAAEPQATQAQATTQATASVPQDEARKPDVNDRYCLRHTGTRIAARTDNRKPRACTNAAIGRGYNREDLDRTGEIDIAAALRKLDPAIY